MAISKWGVEIPDGKPWLNNTIYAAVSGEPLPPIPPELTEVMIKAFEETFDIKIKRINTNLR